MSSVIPRDLEQTFERPGVSVSAGLLHDAPHATVRGISDPRDGLLEPHTMIATRSHTDCASSIECVVSRMLRPLLRMPSIRSQS